MPRVKRSLTQPRSAPPSSRPNVSSKRFGIPHASISCPHTRRPLRHFYSHLSNLNTIVKNAFLDTDLVTKITFISEQEQASFDKKRSIHTTSTNSLVRSRIDALNKENHALHCLRNALAYLTLVLKFNENKCNTSSHIIFIFYQLWQSPDVHFIDNVTTIRQQLSMLYHISDSDTRHQWLESLPFDGMSFIL